MDVTGRRRKGYTYGYTEGHNKKGPSPPRTPKKSALKLCVGRHASTTPFMLGLFLHAGVGIRMCVVSEEQVAGDLSDVVDMMLLPLIEQRESAIIKREIGTLSVQCDLMTAKQKVDELRAASGSAETDERKDDET